MTMPSTPWRPLYRLFAEGRPDDWRVSHDGRRFIVWAEFAGRVDGLAAVLRTRPEKRWLLVQNDPMDFIVGLFATLQAGKAAVIPPNTQPGTLTALAGAFDACVDFAAAIDISPEPSFSIDPAAIIDLYTSGSAGEHKRVRKTLAQFDAEVTVLESLWGERLGRSVMVATAPHQHIYGLLFRLFWPLASGRVFDAVTCGDPDLLVERLSFFQRAALISSPAQLTRLPELILPGSLNPKPVMVFSSGGPLPSSTSRTWAEGLGEAPVEVFGSTETGGVAWRQNDGQNNDLWTPFPCHKIDRLASGALALVSPFLNNNMLHEMDDAIELFPEGRFRLLGRLDRVVKIEEKRLSLPEMETRLATHPWVETSAVALLTGRRQGIGVALLLTQMGREYLETQGRRKVTQTLRQYLTAYFDAVLLPRRWRFPDSLPFDARGKLPTAALMALFSDEILLPEVLRIERNGTFKVRLKLYVRPEIVHFSGHFPDFAILPGVVQVDWAAYFARVHLPLAGNFSALENLKFLAIVRPGDRLMLSLVWDANSRCLEFSYAGSESGRKYSTGQFVFWDVME